MSSQSTSTPTPPTNMSNGALSNTSSLLFGFLVSALSVFAVFMTIAIVWNRLVARRRAIDATLAISPPPPPQSLCQPTMWDIWTVPDTQLPPLVECKPLAARRGDHAPSSALAAQTTQTLSFWRHRLLDGLPPEITYLFRQPVLETSAASSVTHISQVELSHGSDTQISLLICMPRAPLVKREEMFHEMAFATTNIIYHDPRPSS